MILKKICLNRLRSYLKRSMEGRSGSNSFRKSRKLLTKSPKAKIRKFRKGNRVFLLAVIVLLSFN
jgi:hypothetical protein